MNGLSPDRALLMEIALELLGNTVHDIHGRKKSNLVELFKENVFSSSRNHQGAPEDPPQREFIQPRYGTNSHPFANEELDEQQYMLEELSNAFNSQEDLQQKEKNDREFVESMLRKIDIEYANLKKISSKQRQSYFLNFWVRVVNEHSECPDVTEEDIDVIAQEYFAVEQRNLEAQCKDFKEKIIEMKRSATSDEEIVKIRRIAEKIALVKKALEESIRNPSENC
ncbi:uncharacterized protein LOC129788615 [Lutzomyia longipalpis]|uniref:uncharacterized protein LOC129788615 n=1 Tax=Lutzomyia longipalpis TaxID=7200 RepID=UPI0024835CE5|nr:uncharacterized protein LOC129788615 [Lutzomyia longipalpis]